MTKDERIAALREALDLLRKRLVAAHQDIHGAMIARSALAADDLAADDLAAAEPLPDLPLAEGSRWTKSSVVTGGGVIMTASKNRGQPVVDVRLRCGEEYWVPMLDVLALARRAGVV